jgi:hypothetical protein
MRRPQIQGTRTGLQRFVLLLLVFFLTVVVLWQAHHRSVGRRDVPPLQLAQPMHCSQPCAGGSGFEFLAAIEGSFVVVITPFPGHLPAVCPAPHPARLAGRHAYACMHACMHMRICMYAAAAPKPRTNANWPK